MAIKVRALTPGYLGYYREQDEEFEIETEQEFSKRWMEKVDESEKPLVSEDTDPQIKRETRSSKSKRMHEPEI